MTDRTRIQRKKQPVAEQAQSALTGGQPLDAATRTALEPRFGHSFADVRVHTDERAAQSAEALDARAYTAGSDIAFGAGQYAPGTPAGDHLLAHELTHVVQQHNGTLSTQTRLTTSTPGDATEREAETVADAVMHGEAVQVQQPAQANIHGNWLGDAVSAVGNAVGDALDVRYNEAERDAYEDATSALRDFQQQTYKAENFQSTTRLGMFDATYNPQGGELLVECKCKFNFVPGSAAEFPSASAADLAWTDQAAMDTWKSNFISTVSTKWSSGNHVFHCQKDWWELLAPRVKVEVKAVDSGEHFALSITKIPTGQFRGSSVTAPTVSTGADGNQTYTPGSGDFDSEDLTKVNKPGGEQVGAVHETGHMLGLDDEYNTGETGAPSHDPMVQSEFGHGVARGADGRIMSGGMDIQPEHGVTFLAALKQATGIQEWATTPKAPRPVPATEAPGMGDFPTPRQDQVPV